MSVVFRVVVLVVEWQHGAPPETQQVLLDISSVLFLVADLLEDVHAGSDFVNLLRRLEG